MTEKRSLSEVLSILVDRVRRVESDAAFVRAVLEGMKSKAAAAAPVPKSAEPSTTSGHPLSGSPQAPCPSPG